MLGGLVWIWAAFVLMSANAEIVREGVGKGGDWARHFLSHDADRWAVDFLSRSRTEGRANAFAAAWTSFFVANV